MDRFGNLITNIGREAVERLVRTGAIDIAIGGHVGAAPGRHLRRRRRRASSCALFGSSDHLEIAVSGGSAAARLGAGAGATVTLGQAGRCDTIGGRP